MANTKKYLKNINLDDEVITDIDLSRLDAIQNSLDDVNFTENDVLQKQAEFLKRIIIALGGNIQYAVPNQIVQINVTNEPQGYMFIDSGISFTDNYQEMDWNS